MPMRVMAGFVCLFVVLVSSCTSPSTQLPVSTPEFTPEIPTAAPTSVDGLPSPVATLRPTSIPGDALRPENLEQVRMLHQYWLAMATAAGVDPYEMDVSAVAASPDGRLIAVGGCSRPLESDLRSGNVYCGGADSESPEGIPFLVILDADTEGIVGIVPENEPETTMADLTFSPNGQKLIYAVHPGRFAVWDVEAEEIESVLWEGDTSAPKVAVSPDGRWIALKDTDQVQIWDTTIEEFVAEISAYYRPQFSADSRQIVVYYDRQFVVHESGAWAESLRFGLPCDCVYAISPDLSLLATSERSSAEDAAILIWDTSTGEQIQSIPSGRGFTAFLAFTPDGKMLWRAGDRGDLMAWDTGEWELLAKHIGGITPIFNLHGFLFTGDGRRYVLISDLLLGLYGLP